MPKRKSGETIRQQIIIEARKKYGDEMPLGRLAKAIQKENPTVFATPEIARSAIRHVVGKNGEESRGKRIRRGSAKYFEEIERTRNAHVVPGLPKSHAELWEPFIIHGAQRIAILSDIHFPFHDEVALEAAIEHCAKINPTIVLLNGDIIDGYEQSRFDKDPRRRTAVAELQMLKELFAYLRHRFPLARIIYKEGNHDERWGHYVARHCPVLFGMPEFNLYSMAECAKYGVEHVNDRRIIKAGKLNILHGHEIFGGGGVNPARALFLKTSNNAIIGHWHRSSEHYEKLLDNSIIGGWSTGCLCDMHPEYARINKWGHGAATVAVEEDGSFTVDNFRIIDGKIH